ncbi:MAG TPA: OmpA family protein [Solimonas sp.]|nr:OmpA family protein [Solimonas sp.]
MRMISAAALAMFGIAPAYAVTTDGYDIPYVGAFYSYELSDSKRDSENGQGFQINAGMPLDWGSNNALELSFHDLGRERDIDGKKDYQTGLFLDLVHHYGEPKLNLMGGEKYVPRFTPFMLAGAGVLQEDVRGDDHIHGGINFGAGLLFPLPWYGLGIRTEARAQAQYNDESVSGEDFLIDYRFNVGLQIPLTPIFGERAAPAGKPGECEIAVVDPVTGRTDCAIDTDQDGIFDSVDQCPGTPAGSAVNTNGCPVVGGNSDADADGVPDVADRCPETKAGMTVDMSGCVVGQTMTLQGVKFHNNSAELTSESKGILDGVGRTLNSQKNLSVEIGGHTDAIGTEAFNLLLSQQRAESVRQYLIAHGIDGKRMVAQGYGELQPVGSNDSEAGRDTNRRVEFKIIVQ